SQCHGVFSRRWEFGCRVGPFRRFGGRLLGASVVRYFTFADFVRELLQYEVVIVPAPAISIFLRCFDLFRAFPGSMKLSLVVHQSWKTKTYFEN
ncbi:MAG: hypothetical protein ACOCUY_01060, partial [Verrucomicrobiota bacterium]